MHYSLDEIGFPYDSVRNYDVLYHQFGQSWRIRQQDSLFVYPKGMSTRSYTNLAFPSEALTIPSLAPTKISGAERACKAAGITNPDLLADCVFDVGVTGESCFAGGDAQIQATTGGPPVTDMPPSSGTVPSTPAGTHLTVDSQADSTGPVVVDSAGNGYVAWDSHARGDEADHVLFCKIPAGGTCTHKITLALPGNSTNSQDAIVQPFPVLGRAPGVVYVVGPRYVRSDVVVWTSHDGGSTFSAGVTVPSPSYVGNTGVDDVLQSPLNPSTAIDYFSIASNNVGLGYSFTGPGTVGGPSPASFTFNTGGVPGSVLGATLGFSGQQMVEAFWTDADTPTVDYYWSPTYELGGAQSALEHGPTKVSDGTNARLASGPEGLFLLSEDSGGASKPLRLHLRKWDPSTHTFGSLTFVGLVANDMDSANQGGLAEDAATGALYVAWPGHDANGNYVMYLWTSTNGGKAFSGPTTVADINSAYEGPARLAATGGHGFLTFQDGGGLELVDLASL